MGIRYYSTQRPPAPGAYPRPAENKVLEVKGFCSRVYTRAIDRPAWGYVEYEKPLSPSDISSYELVPGELTCTVLRPLTDEEADLFETGPMYQVRFSDGTETSTFIDELTLASEMKGDEQQ